MRGQDGYRTKFLKTFAMGKICYNILIGSIWRGTRKGENPDGISFRAYRAEELR